MAEIGTDLYLAYENGYEAGKNDATQKWISVKERLPEDETPVLVWGGRSIYTAVYGNRGGYSNHWWKLNGKPSHYCNPKFWMPLPEPPKEGGENE